MNLHHNACSAFEKVGNYWYLLPQFNQCRKAIWDAVNPHTGKKRLSEVFPMEVRKKTLDQEMKIELLNGSTWQLIGSDNYDALVGSTPRGITFSEYALSNPNAWGFLRPILLENNGWAIFNSTPRGKNHFKNMMDMAIKDHEWMGQILTAKDTGIFTEAQLQGELRELQIEHGETYGRAIWLQEYFCSFDAAIPGSIWGESIMNAKDKVCVFDHEPGFKVFTAWDLGRDDFTAAWFFQVIGEEIRIIDYYEVNFKEIPDIVFDLKGKQDLGYDFGKHWAPHDAKPVRLGMGGKSMMQQFVEGSKDLGVGGTWDLVPNVGREKGIQAGRVTFRNAYFKSDNDDVMDGLEHLKSYHRRYDEKTKTFSEEPVHDNSSHAADAWRMLSLVWQVSRAYSKTMSQAEKFSAGNVVNVNFGALKEEHFRRKREAEYGFER